MERLRIESDGDVLPGANGSQDLGSSSKRWNTIYANNINGTITGTISNAINANNVNINNITSSNDTKKFIHFGDLNNGYDGVEVDSTTLVYRNKNIGIGTDDPDQKLHVVTTSNDAIPLLLERTHTNNVIAEFKILRPICMWD